MSEKIEHISDYDNSRETIGAIYRNAQIHGDKTPILNDDLTKVMASSLVEDLNEAIELGTKEWGENPFYLIVHEKKDMTMPRALLRRIIRKQYRPWPEDDTLVFRVFPSSNDVVFCWCLPHHTDMDNFLANEMLYDKDLIASIKAYRSMNLEHFGFVKIGIGEEWEANPNFKDAKMTPIQPIELMFA